MVTYDKIYVVFKNVIKLVMKLKDYSIILKKSALKVQLQTGFVQRKDL